MSKRNRSSFLKAKLTRCTNQALVHAGALGKAHRGCAHNATKAVCVWEKL